MIANLQVKDYKGFTGGKNTYTTLTETPLEACLVARDVAISADGVIRKRPGYSKIAQPLGGAVGRIFDFQRPSDDTQRIFVAGNGQLVTVDTAGGGPVELAAVDEQAIFDFAPSLFACYLSNGKQALRYINSGGKDVIFDWGLPTPATAPTVAVGAGTLNLQYGRQYVYCAVSIVTDGAGNQYLSVGAPSPFSASSGPVADGIVTVGTIPVSADPQVTHWWIFATVDSPFGTQAAYFFAAQIPNGTTSWADALGDDQLDTTRQAPWDNYPAPPAELLIEFQSRIAAIGIPGKLNLVQLSGYEEIDLGIPQEAWPPDLFFTVPGGTQEIQSAVVYANQLMLGTVDFWFSLGGYNAQTFVKNDKIAQPGPAGRRLATTTKTHMIWVSKDRKLWAWDTVNTPIELSLYTRRQLAGTLSMEDIDPQTLAGGVLLYLEYGAQHWIVLLCNSPNYAGPGFDWAMAWDLDSQGAPEQQSEVAQAGRAAQFDAFFADYMTAGAIVEVNGARQLWLGDVAGNLYRFPDGWTDAGKIYRPVYGTPWHHLGLQSAFFNQGPSALKKRMLWVDVATDRDDAADAFAVAAVVADGVPMDVVPAALPVTAVPAGAAGRSDPTALRALHNVPGASLGRWVRWIFRFPADDQAASIYQYSPAFVPLYQGAP